MDRDDEWSVALDGRCVVGFYGPDARELAERHKSELADLIALRDAGAIVADDSTR